MNREQGEPAARKQYLQAMTTFNALASSHALNEENNKYLYLLHQMLINANLIKE